MMHGDPALGRAPELLVLDLARVSFEISIGFAMQPDDE